VNLNRNKIFKAGFWVLAAFGASQIVRLIGNLLATRMLTPDIFGVVAIVWVVLHGINMFSDVVREEKKDSDDFYNTVWTMQMARGWILFFIIILFGLTLYLLQNEFSVNLQDVYSNKQLPFILFAVSVIAIFNGYKTLAPGILSRKLKRGRLEFIELVSQICGVIVMLVWAFLSPTIWSLVSAGIISAGVNFLLTNRMFDIRHTIKWDKKVVLKVYHFGKWIFLASALTYIAQQGDRIFFSLHVSAEKIGIYSIAYMLVMVVVTVIESLSTKVWYPVFCNATVEISRLSNKYYKVRLYSQTVSLLVMLFLILASPALIDFLYDSRYQDAGWMLQILAFTLFGTTISSVSKVCLTALGKTKVQMQVMLVRSVALLIMLPMMYAQYGFIGAILAFSINPYIAIPVQFFWLSRVKVLNLAKEMFTFMSVILFMVIIYIFDYYKLLNVG